LQAYYQLFTDAVPEGFSDPLGLLFFIPINTIFLAFGIFAIHTTVKIWTHLSASEIRRLIAIGAVILWGMLANLFQYLPPSFQIESESNWSSLAGIGSVLLTVLFYLSMSRWLIARSSTPAEPPRLASPNLAGLFCLMIFVGLSILIFELAPKEPGHLGLPIEPWGFASLLVPLLVAGVLYKAILHLSARRVKRYKQSQRSVTIIG
jgi:predicted permease